MFCTQLVQNAAEQDSPMRKLLCGTGNPAVGTGFDGNPAAASVLPTFTQMEGMESDWMGGTQSACDCLESWFGSRHKAGRRRRGRCSGRKPGKVALGEMCVGQGRDLEPATRMSQGTFLRGFSSRKDHCFAWSPSPSPPLPGPTTLVFAPILF